MPEEVDAGPRIHAQKSMPVPEFMPEKSMPVPEFMPEVDACPESREQI